MAGFVLLWLFVCLCAFVLWLGYRIVQWLATPVPKPPEPPLPEPRTEPPTRHELAEAALAAYTEDLMLAELVEDEQLRKAMQREAKAKLARALRRIQEMAGGTDGSPTGGRRPGWVRP